VLGAFRVLGRRRGRLGFPRSRTGFSANWRRRVGSGERAAWRRLVGDDALGAPRLLSRLGRAPPSASWWGFLCSSTTSLPVGAPVVSPPSRKTIHPVACLGVPASLRVQGPTFYGARRYSTGASSGARETATCAGGRGQFGWPARSPLHEGGRLRGFRHGLLVRAAGFGSRVAGSGSGGARLGCRFGLGLRLFLAFFLASYCAGLARSDHLCILRGRK